MTLKEAIDYFTVLTPSNYTTEEAGITIINALKQSQKRERETWKRMAVKCVDKIQWPTGEDALCSSLPTGKDKCTRRSCPVMKGVGK
jgi:hypothetical protein